MPIRLATTSDLDAIAWVAVAASPADPIFPYRYPHMDQYPEDFAKYTRIRYGEYLADPNSVVMVFECPSIEDTSVSKLVAFSIWVPPPSQEPAHAGVSATQSALNTTPTGNAQNRKPVDRPERRDASPARMMAFRANISAAKQRLFDESYGDSQLYLGMLACHPDYQRRGAGTQLVEWGISKARAEKLTLTLFASPMGAFLYKHLGFRDAGGFRTQVPGEDEFLDSKAMVLELE
ncbi:acyl-CoA N-acyltransferase [Nemania abortiva]|nr:acyl-CoA N-acyltransferase [Nemania abortiva]